LALSALERAAKQRKVRNSMSSTTYALQMAAVAVLARLCAIGSFGHGTTTGMWLTAPFSGNATKRPARLLGPPPM
jgi:hypothetical protein